MLVYYILFVSSLLDFVSTSYLISKQGVRVELNPFLYSMMNYVNNPYIVLAAVKLLPFIILFLFLRKDMLKIGKAVKGLVYFATIFQTVIACYGTFVVIQS